MFLKISTSRSMIIMGFLKAGNMIKSYSRLSIGMSKKDVLQMLGQPTGTRTFNGRETLTRKNTEFKGLLRGGHVVRVITVDFENGIVTGHDADNMDRSQW